MFEKIGGLSPVRPSRTMRPATRLLLLSTAIGILGILVRYLANSRSIIMTKNLLLIL